MKRRLKYGDRRYAHATEYLSTPPANHPQRTQKYVKIRGIKRGHHKINLGENFKSRRQRIYQILFSKTAAVRPFFEQWGFSGGRSCKPATKGGRNPPLDPPPRLVQVTH